MYLFHIARRYRHLSYGVLLTTVCGCLLQANVEWSPRAWPVHVPPLYHRQRHTLPLFPLRLLFYTATCRRVNTGALLVLIFACAVVHRSLRIAQHSAPPVLPFVKGRIAQLSVIAVPAWLYIYMFRREPYRSQDRPCLKVPLHCSDLCVQEAQHQAVVQATRCAVGRCCRCCCYCCC